MNRIKRELIIGIWLVVMPLLNIPPSWKTIATVSTGVFIIYMVFKTINQIRKKQQHLEFQAKEENTTGKNEI